MADHIIDSIRDLLGMGSKSPSDVEYRQKGHRHPQERLEAKHEHNISHEGHTARVPDGSNPPLARRGGERRMSGGPPTP
jgi:hypothetical protein